MGCIYCGLHTHDFKALTAFRLDPRIPDEGVEVQERRVVKLDSQRLFETRER